MKNNKLSLFIVSIFSLILLSSCLPRTSSSSAASTSTDLLLMQKLAEGFSTGSGNGGSSCGGCNSCCCNTCNSEKETCQSLVVVTDDQGNFISDVALTIFGSEYNNIYYTDDDGTTNIYDLSDGNYLIRATKSDYLSKTLQLHISNTFCPVISIVLTPTITPAKTCGTVFTVYKEVLGGEKIDGAIVKINNTSHTTVNGVTAIADLKNATYEYSVTKDPDYLETKGTYTTLVPTCPPESVVLKAIPKNSNTQLVTAYVNPSISDDGLESNWSTKNYVGSDGLIKAGTTATIRSDMRAGVWFKTTATPTATDIKATFDGVEICKGKTICGDGSVSINITHTEDQNIVPAGLHTIVITVTAENGSTQDHTLLVYKQSFDARATLPSSKFIAADRTSVKISASVNHPKATIYACIDTICIGKESPTTSINGILPTPGDTSLTRKEYTVSFFIVPEDKTQTPIEPRTIMVTKRSSNVSIQTPAVIVDGKASEENPEKVYPNDSDYEQTVYHDVDKAAILVASEYAIPSPYQQSIKIGSCDATKKCPVDLPNTLEKEPNLFVIKVQPDSPTASEATDEDPVVGTKDYKLRVIRGFTNTGIIIPKPATGGKGPFGFSMDASKHYLFAGTTVSSNFAYLYNIKNLTSSNTAPIKSLITSGTLCYGKISKNESKLGLGCIYQSASDDIRGVSFAVHPSDKLTKNLALNLNNGFVDLYNLDPTTDTVTQQASLIEHYGDSSVFNNAKTFILHGASGLFGTGVSLTSDGSTLLTAAPHKYILQKSGNNEATSDELLYLFNNCKNPQPEDGECRYFAARTSDMGKEFDKYTLLEDNYSFRHTYTYNTINLNMSVSDVKPTTSVTYLNGFFNSKDQPVYYEDGGAYYSKDGTLIKNIGHNPRSVYDDMIGVLGSSSNFKIYSEDLQNVFLDSSLASYAQKAYSGNASIIIDKYRKIAVTVVNSSSNNKDVYLYIYTSPAGANTWKLSQIIKTDSTLGSMANASTNGTDLFLGGAFCADDAKTCSNTYGDTTASDPLKILYYNLRGQSVD